MTTLNLVIICAAALTGLVVASRALVERDARRAQLQRETAMHARAAAAPVADLARAVETLTATAAALERHAGERGPSRVGHRVTVHTKQPDDQTIFGVVVGDYVDRVSLEDAEYVFASRPNSALPGRQDVATADIAWIDVHGHVAAELSVEA